MKRFALLAIGMVAVLAFAAAGFAQPKGGTKGQSTRASQTLVCKDAGWNVVFPCGLPEDTSNPLAGSYGTGNAFGQIQYDTSSAGGNETMRLILHGLQANTWYLVTMQDPTNNNQFTNNGASCLFGVKGSPGALEFCDVALVKTDSGGNVNALVPTDSAITGNANPVCTSGNVPALTVGPMLGIGTYSGITMVVKNVGVGSDGTAPNCGTLITGGSAELFERNALPTFTAP